LRLEDLVGQQRAAVVLRNMLRRDRVAHAYLFSGPEGVGKSTAAVLFAKALNCEADNEGAPCESCRACKLIARGTHPDVRTVTVSTDSGGRRRSEISIDQIRQNPKKPKEWPRPLIQDAYLKPAMGPYKVYIIDPADRLTAEAGNALLKVLEEPPAHVVLILVASESSALLPTVISRCQQVVFQLAGTDEIERYLAGMGVEPPAAASLARLSGGRVAWAARAAQRPEVLSVRAALLDLCADMGDRHLPASLRVAEDIKVQAARLTEDLGEGEEEEEEETGSVSFPGDRELRAQLPWCLDVMVTWYRDLLAIGEEGALLNPDYERALRERFHPGLATEAECAVESILETKHAIQRNANIDIALESLVIGLVGACD